LAAWQSSLGWGMKSYVSEARMPELYFDRNDNILEWFGAYTIDVGSGQRVYLDANATVTVTVIDLLTSIAISGVTWPVALAYVAGSRGNFIGVLSNDMVVTPGQALVAQVTGDNGANEHFERDVDVLVVEPRG
jgi:hypothetical protein